MAYKREGKLYEKKNSATRAAKEDGLVEGQFEVVSEGKQFKYLVKDVHKGVATQFEREQVRKKIEERKLAHKPSPVGKPPEKKEPPPKKIVKKAEPLIEEDDLPRKTMTVVDYGDGSLQKHEEEERLQKEKEEKEAKAIAEAEASVKKEKAVAPRVVKDIPTKPDGKLHKSTVESPTKLVWSIAEEMTMANPSTSRKQVIAECTRRGIAFYTARTQYQQWLSMVRESKMNQEKANRRA